MFNRIRFVLRCSMNVIIVVLSFRPSLTFWLLCRIFRWIFFWQRFAISCFSRSHSALHRRRRSVVNESCESNRTNGFINWKAQLKYCEDKNWNNDIETFRVSFVMSQETNLIMKTQLQVQTFKKFRIYLFSRFSHIRWWVSWTDGECWCWRGEGQTQNFGSVLSLKNFLSSSISFNRLPILIMCWRSTGEN